MNLKGTEYKSEKGKKMEEFTIKKPTRSSRRGKM